MQFNICKIFSIMMVCFTFACNQSTNSSGGNPKNPSQISIDVAQKVTNRAKLPEVSDTMTLEYWDFYDSTNDTCKYLTTEKRTISNISETNIEVTYDRTFVADSSNSSECPTQHPEFVAHETFAEKTVDYTKRKIEFIKKELDPIEYQKSSWIQSAKIVSNEEVNFKGLRVQLVELEIDSKTGNKYTLKQYVALDSLFLARIEFLQTHVKSGEIVAFQALKDFQVKKLQGFNDRSTE
jgi:hypothetical protein